MQFLKPRVLVSWTPSRAQQVSLRVEREVSQLSFSDYINTADLKNDTQTAGNVGIVPDQTQVYELRYQWRSGRASFSAEYAFRERIDIIDNAYLLTNAPLPDPLPVHCDPSMPATYSSTATDCYLIGAETQRKHRRRVRASGQHQCGDPDRPGGNSQWPGERWLHLPRRQS